MPEPNLSVTKWYQGQTLFITGASGFMGKVLLEKLLYSCDGIKRIYVLIRQKRYKTAESRLEEMLKVPAFNRLRKEKPESLKKIVAIQGDISIDSLGLTPESKIILQEEVTVVFHCAATLRLEANLKDAVQMNTAGTWRILQLAKDMKNLVAFLHLSTAFCHCDIEELEEAVYDAPVDPLDIMRCGQWMDEATLELITSRLMGPHPNTYTYTKRLAERLVSNEFPRLPVAIARPSIVTPAWQEPMPGWVDSLNGPVGLLVGGGKGVIRSMHCKGEYNAEVIPVDVAINALITVAWKTGTNRETLKEIPVYNITASAMKPITWTEVLDQGRKVVHENPFEMTIWYPDGNIRSSKFMHNLCVIFLHFLPAYIIDFLLFVFRQKTFMVRIQRKIQDGLEVLQYFTTRQWIFRSDNFTTLRNELGPEEGKIFFTDVETIDTDEYLKDAVLGARQYILKEPLSSLPRCRRNLKILYVVDKVWSVLFYMMILWLIVSYSDTARYIFDVTGDYIKEVPVIGALVTRSDMLDS